MAATFTLAAAVAPVAHALPIRNPAAGDAVGNSVPPGTVAESKNDGRYKKSNEGRKAERLRRQCDSIQRTIDTYKALYEKAKAKDPNSAETLQLLDLWGFYVHAHARLCSA